MWAGSGRSAARGAFVGRHLRAGRFVLCSHRKGMSHTKKERFNTLLTHQRNVPYGKGTFPCAKSLRSSFCVKSPRSSYTGLYLLIMGSADLVPGNSHPPRIARGLGVSYERGTPVLRVWTSYGGERLAAESPCQHNTLSSDSTCLACHPEMTLYMTLNMPAFHLLSAMGRLTQTWYGGERLAAE